MFFAKPSSASVPIRQLLKETKLSEVMAVPVITVNEGDEFHVVQEKFNSHDIRHLPVVDDTGGVIGLITQRDLYKVHSPRKLEDGGLYYDKEMLDNFILKNVMCKKPFTLRADNTLEEAMKAMIQSKFGCIPIVDSYRLPVGILTRIDILKFFLTK